MKLGGRALHCLQKWSLFSIEYYFFLRLHRETVGNLGKPGNVRNLYSQPIVGVAIGSRNVSGVEEELVVEERTQ